MVAPTKRSQRQAESEWVLHWKRHVADVSTDPKLSLWSTVQVIERKRSGSFGLRTLDVLSNLSEGELGLFEKLGAFVFCDRYVWMPQYETLTSLYEWRMDTLAEEALILLEEAGLLTGITTPCGRFDLKSKKVDRLDASFALANVLIFVGHTDPSEVLSLPVARLTEAGKELAWLYSPKADANYLRHFCSDIWQKSFTVSTGRINFEVEGGWDHEVAVPHIPTLRLDLDVRR